MSSGTLPYSPVTYRTRLARISPLVAFCWVVLGLAVFAAIFGPLFVGDPEETNIANAYLGPSAGHPLGFDGQGADLTARIVVGARTSLLGPAVVVVISFLVGTTLAVAAAWWGGWVDKSVSTAMDILFGFPAILLAILAAAVFGAGLWAATIAVAIAYVPFIARILRSQVIRERSLEYIAAAEVQGVSSWGICWRHLVPNVAPLIVAQATLVFGYAMVDLAAISFLGLGPQPPQPDWGTMVATGKSGVLQGYPAESLAAGLCIILVVVSVSIIGERYGERLQR